MNEFVQHEKEKKNESAELKQITLFERETNYGAPAIVILTRGAG
jgi:hypothetical protein